jgi:M3 family oligoendopeptidase
MTYKYYPQRPERVTAEFMREEYRKLTDRIESAERSDSPEEWLRLYADWNALEAYTGGEGSRIGYAYSKDMTDPVREEADRYYREEVSPVIADGESMLVNALIRSRHRDAIAGHYGQQLIRRLEVSVEPLAPVNRDLRVRGGSVAKEYSKIVASGEVTIDGESMTLAMAGSLMTSQQWELRRQAFIAVRDWFLEHRDQLGGIYAELVKLRTEMARNLGHENFVPLGYLGMGRTDYGPEQAAAFRRNVRQYAVPLLKRLREQQAEELGMTVLKPWDTSYDPSLTLPREIAPVDTQLDNAQRVFEALSPRLAGHFTRMRQEGLIDLENRKGKQAGAYCTEFPDEGCAAIFCNSIGDAEDVRTLLHEMGHAFQKWESQAIEAITLHYPTSDAAEIHSMGMEYLSMRHIDRFFDQENAAKFRQGRWKKAVTLLCYVSVVDEFQHWVYEHPDASLDERDEAWNRIWDIYEAGIDFTGIEKYKSLRWYQQMHIFRAPFYYIDYAIAEMGAMQLALIDAEDHERAMEIYMNLCRIGGTMSVLDIFRSAGLGSPFDPEVMRDLMRHAASELGVEEEVVA